MAAEIGINKPEVNDVAREPITIVPVTAAIYHNGQEKPTERWSFELGLSVSENKLLSSILKWLERGHGVKDKASALGIARFKIQLSVKDFTRKLPDWPKGRVFAVDYQEQWGNCFPQVLGLQRELIVKIFEVEITKLHDILMTHKNNTSDQTPSDKSSSKSGKSDDSDKTAKKKSPNQDKQEE
eukprot:gene2785-3222_t